MSDEQAITALIARAISDLGETEAEPQAQLARLVRFLGGEATERLLAETLSVQGAGGMPTMSGERMRTPGGVFFYLAKQGMTHEQQMVFWPPPFRRKKRKGEGVGSQSAAQLLGTDTAPDYVYADRVTVIMTMEQGEAHVVTDL